MRIVFRSLSVLALALGVLVGLYQFGLYPFQNPREPLLSEIALPDIHGEVQHGAQWLGKVVLVNHWASWCPPCVKEIPDLIETQERFAERGFQVVGIAHDSPAAARAFGHELGINYPSLIANEDGSALMVRHGSSPFANLPFTAIFDRNGELAQTQLGLMSSQDIVNLVEPLL